MQRRDFMAAGFTTGAALSVSELKGQERAPVRVGVIGAGGRGRFLTEQFKEIGARMDAVCDIYEPNLKRGLAVASTGARSYSDYRRLLEDRSLEAVIIATPDHWHARQAIDAVEAGKDVYLEKPLAHTIDEGFALIDAVRRTKRILQVGTQRRSAPLFQEARANMPKLGDVRLVTSVWLNHQQGLTQRPLEGKLDWQQWLGSAPKRELDPMRFHNWYYFWDYSGGLLIGQAAHIVDAIHWFMGSRAPVTVSCTGGKGNLPGAEVPETASLTIEYPENYLANFTIGYKAMRYHIHNDQLVQYHGDKARLDVGREHWALILEDPKALDLKPSSQVRQPGSFGPATRDHIRNFLECVRSRQEPTAPVEEGQSTNIVLAMAMQSMRSGRTLRWNAAQRKVEG
jgi:predicted dehydrogenase